MVIFYGNCRKLIQNALHKHLQNNCYVSGTDVYTGMLHSVRSRPRCHFVKFNYNKFEE